MAESFPMKGGEGAYSYTKNSLLQRDAADNVKVMIREAIVENLDIQTQKSTSSTFLITDFGCSVGPNTFFAMQNVIEAIKEKYHSLNSASPEFQVFFNDHVTNDFNTLFKSLPSERPYKFAAAVPGSFYGRLFPSCSLHFAYSFYALQWLSESPKELVDVKNKGRILYEGATTAVWNAYVAQFDKDMEVFLSARAEEIVPGGLMVLVFPAITSEMHHDSQHGYRIFTFLESILIDMANEGIVDESLVDSFNLPIYLSSAKHMTKIVKKNGCFRLEKIELAYPPPLIDAKSYLTHARAGLEGIFTKHFGSTIADEVFARTLEKSEEISSWLNGEYYKTVRQLVVVLKRNK